MASKTTFTPRGVDTESWRASCSPGMAVTAADPSGLFGVLKELMATGRTLLAAKADPTSNELIKSVVGDFETGEGRQAARNQVQSRLKGVPITEMKGKSIAALREMSQLLDSKAPGDSPASRLGCITLPKCRRGLGGRWLHGVWRHASERGRKSNAGRAMQGARYPA